MRRLSDTQRHWLQLLVNNGGWSGGPNRTLDALKRRGLVRFKRTSILSGKWLATDAGRVAVFTISVKDTANAD